MNYWAQRKKIERLTTNRFYELVLELDPNYSQSLGEVRTTISDMDIYKLKKQASAEIAASLGVSELKNKKGRKLHVDLLNDAEFMKFCIKLSPNRDWKKYHRAYRAFCDETAKAAAKELNTNFYDIYRLIKIYKGAAEQYKRERDAKLIGYVQGG